MEDTSKIFMVPDSRGTSTAETMALMNGGCNNWMNNPFMYLIWLAFFGGGNGFGWGNRNAAQGVELSGQVAQLQQSVNDNHNNNLAMQAIQGNGAAIHELSNNLGCSTQALTAAINNVQSTIGMSGKDIVTSILMGNKDIIQQMASCCCENKQLVTQMGYEGQLRDQTNTCAITTRIGELANGVQQGFASVGYAAQTNTNNIIQAGNANTQRILDTLNNHWTQDLQQRYADAKLELSQQTQNAYLISQLKTT